MHGLDDIPTNVMDCNCVHVLVFLFTARPLNWLVQNSPALISPHLVPQETWGCLFEYQFQCLYQLECHLLEKLLQFIDIVNTTVDLFGNNEKIQWFKSDLRLLHSGSVQVGVLWFLSSCKNMPISALDMINDLCE